MVENVELRNVARDAPLRLAVAAKLAFPDGSMTASGLRREAARGRLRIERIANKDFTTLQAIDEMRERCRVPSDVPQVGEQNDALSERQLMYENSDAKDAAFSAQLALRNRLKSGPKSNR